MKARYISLFIVAFLTPCYILGQTPGLIVDPATGSGKAILDPNGDGYVSTSSAGFVSADQSESEIPYVPIPVPAREPTSDLGPGPDCGFTDFVDEPSGPEVPALAYLDAANNWLFRFRLGNVAPNSKGYSVLIDTDQKFGFTGNNADPNAVAGNPGFEIEISFQSNFGVYLYSVDGTTTPVLKTSYAGHGYYQKSIALTRNCSDADYFYDFYIPFSAITSNFPGITTSTPLRYVIITNMSPSPAIGSNSVSDMGGVDDAAAGYNYDVIFNNVINNFYPVSASGLDSGSPGDRSDCPTISSIAITSTSISGKSTEAAGTVIKIYLNSGATPIGTTTVTSGSPNTWTWNISGVTLVAGDVIYATATATGESESVKNCNPVTVLSCAGTSATPLASEVSAIAGSKGFQVVVNKAIGTVVRCYTSNWVLIDPVALALESPNNKNTVTTTTTPQTVLFSCHTGNCFGNGVYIFTYQEPNKCESGPYYACQYATGGTSGTPTLVTPVYTSTSPITGTGGTATSGSALIYLSLDNIFMGSATTGASSPYNWSYTPTVTRNACQVLSLFQIESGKCKSTEVTATIQKQASAPVITGSYCVSSSPSTVTMTGTTTEPSGTTISVYKGAGTLLTTTTSNAYGSWSANVSVSSGDVVYAKATYAAGCKPESPSSNSVTIGSRTSNTGLAITTSPVTEGATALSGTAPSSGGPFTIKLYIDGYYDGSARFTKTGIASAAAWSMTLLGTDLYAGSQIYVTATGTGCESNASATVTVQCVAPVNKTVSPASTTICAGSTVPVTVTSSESGVIYQLYNGSTATGSSMLGTGNDLVLTTAALTSVTTQTIIVKATKISPVSCTTTLPGTVTVNVNPSPNAALTVTAQASTLCTGESTNIQVQASETGFTYQLKDNATDASIGSPVAGTGSTISLPTGALSATTTYKVVATGISPSFCEVTLTTKPTVTVNQVTLANAGTDQTGASMCGLTSTTLGANIPVYGTGAWSVSSGTGGSFGDATSPVSTFTGNAGGQYTLRWTISNGSCTSTSDVTVAFSHTPSLANAGADQNQSAAISTATLDGNYPSTGTGTWTLVSGSGSATTPNDPKSGVTGLTSGDNSFRWTISNPPCTDSYDEMTIHVNYLPELSAVEGTVLSYVENQGAATITNSITLSDNDNTSLNGAIIQISDNYQNGQDVLAFTNTASITGSWNATTGTLILTGTDNVANYQAALRSITYTNISNNPSILTRTVTFTVSDGTENSVAVTRDIGITAVNDAPAVSDVYKSAITDNTITFAATDFTSAYADEENDALNKIRITSLPASGTLYLSGTAISDEQEINASALANITYVPAAGWTGTTSFAWSGNDGSAYSLSGADVNISITATPNTPPVVSNVTKSVNEDNALTFAVSDFTGSYSDAESNALTKIRITSLPLNATLKLSGVEITLNQEIAVADIVNLTFTPDANWNGIASFEWNGFDGNAYATSGANVNITVNAVNDAPTLSNMVKNVNEDYSLSFAASDFSSAFADVDGNTLTKIRITSLPANGTLKLSGVDVGLNDEITVANLDHLTFVPDAGWNGSISFGWNGYDGTVYASSPARVDITVNAVNDAPALSDIYKSTDEDASLAFTQGDFTAVFSDADGDPLTGIEVISLPANGKLQLSGVDVKVNDEIQVGDLGSLVFVPANNWNGNTSFEWNGADGSVYSAADAYVYITINAVNDAPTLANITATLDEDGVLDNATADFTSAFSDIDGDPLKKIRIISLPAHGTLKLSGIDVAINDEIQAADLGSLEFTPDANWNGSTSFLWNGSDGALYAASNASVYITVTPVNDPPAVSDIHKNLNEDNTLTFTQTDFTASFSDIDGSLSKIKIISLPVNGTLELSSANVHEGDEIPVGDIGNLTFVPDANWNGNTSFTWNGSDGEVYAASDAGVNITVNAVNDLPLAGDISGSMDEDHTLTFSALDFTSSFSDIDGNSLAKISITSLPANGTLKLSGANVSINAEIDEADLGNLSFIPDNNWNGNTSFGWNGYDGTAYALSAANVNISVNAVNDVPVMGNITKALSEDNTLVFAAADFTSAFTDVDLDPLDKIKISSLPANGTLELSGTTVTVHQEIPVSDLGNLTFIPEANWNGSTSFTWNGSDGTVYATTDANVNITVNAANDAPAVSDIYKSALTNTTVAFTSGDFTASYADVENSAMTKIQVITLPSDGTLNLSGTPVIAGAEIGAASLANLTFVPNSGWNGNTSFNWNGSDGSVYALSNALVHITISATPNTAPVVSNVAKSVNEDNILTYAATDFTSAYSDAESNPLIQVRINSLPANGTLRLSNTAVAIYDEIPVASLGNLTFVPDTNWNESTSFDWNGFDGTVYAASSAQVNITVNAVNDAPEVSNISKTTDEDNALSFSATDFTGGFYDVDGNSLSAVKIVSLPVNGTLMLGSVAVEADDEVPIANLDNLRFIPADNWNGVTSFEWSGSDGTVFATSMAKIYVTANALNDAPAVSNIVKSADEDNPVTFAVTDFTGAFSDPDGQIPDRVKIISLPANGTLQLSGVDVYPNEEILTENLSHLSFVPDTNWNGSTSFEWNGSDGIVYASSDAYVNITINAVNDPPNLKDIDITLDEDGVPDHMTVDFTNSFSDADGNSLTKIVIISLPVHGTLKLNGVIVAPNNEIALENLGDLTFVPDTNWNGSTSFLWNASDGTVYASSDARADITVTAVEDAPVVSNISKTENEDNMLVFSATDFTGAFSDVDGNSLTRIQITSLSEHGTLYLSGVALHANDEVLLADIGHLAFVPDENWNGSTSFGWNGSDGINYAALDATVNITVSAVNDAPAVSDIYKFGLTDATMAFTLSDFAGSYTDIENDPLTRIKVQTLPENGLLRINGTDVISGQEIDAADLGNLTFDPNTGWNDGSFFGWNGYDGHDYASSWADVRITISATPNTPPVISDIMKSVNEDDTLTFASTDFTAAYSDGESNPMTLVRITSLPGNGKLLLSGLEVTINNEIPAANLNNLIFVPDANWNGSTSFGWNALDGMVYASANAVVEITVNAINDAPVVSNITLNAYANTVVAFTSTDFSNAYSDVEMDALDRVSFGSLPVHGKIKISGADVNEGQEIDFADLVNLTYVPETGWTGLVTFEWNGSDGSTYADDNANITIVISPAENHEPVLVDTAVSLDEDNIYSFSSSDFTGAFSDADGNFLSKIKIISLPANGKLRLSGVDVNIGDEIPVDSLAHLSYEPDANWNGDVSFGWNGFDGTVYAATDALVYITVNAVNDAPEIITTPLNEYLDEDAGSATFAIQGNLLNVDGDLLATTILEVPLHGTVFVDGSGNIVFTPNANYNGPDTITYRVCDNGTPQLCSTGVIAINVAAVNDRPGIEVSPLILTTPENSDPITIDIPGNTVNVDHDTLTTSIVSNPRNGTATVNGSGEIIYTPETGFTGNDTIIYEVCDSQGLCATGTLVIQVTSTTPVNQAPVISDLEKTTERNSSLQFARTDFKTVFTDADNDTLVTIRITSLPAHGTLLLNGIPITAGQVISWADLNALQFEPETDYTGETSFTWVASDGKDYSATASVLITVTMPEVFVPEGFSPNGDGINDFFVIAGAGQYVVELQIFNRWGDKVYESKHYQNNWDGFSNTGLYLGEELPDGTYFYIIHTNNGDREKIGTITINR